LRAAFAIWASGTTSGFVTALGGAGLAEAAALGGLALAGLEAIADAGAGLLARAGALAAAVVTNGELAGAFAAGELTCGAPPQAARRRSTAWLRIRRIADTRQQCSWNSLTLALSRSYADGECGRGDCPRTIGAMSEEARVPVELTVDGGIATVTLNRPEVRNAIDDAARTELSRILERVSHDSDVRALILTGAGTAFCAGGDIKAMQQRLEASAGDVAANGWRRQRHTHEAVNALHELEKPTIAAVNGAAAGLGCDLALCCDLIIASETASFSMSYVLRGLVPDGGGLYFLPRRVGLPRAKELIFSARRVSAQEALAIGLADRLVKPDELLAEARRWADELTRGSSIALALAKSILDQSFERGVEEVFGLGGQAQAICYTTSEHRQAVEAFLKKA